MNTKLKTKINIYNTLFIIAYGSFYVSLVLNDIYQISDSIGIMSKCLRMITYAISVILFLQSGIRVDDLWKLIFLLGIFIIYTIVTKDTYLISIVLLVYGSRKYDTTKLFSYSFRILFVCTLLTILLMLIGVLPDYLTAKAFATELSRHSLGFYHSDVFPATIVYLQVYYNWEHRQKTKTKNQFVFVIFHLVAYFLCSSRVCVIVGLSYSFMVLFVSAIKSIRLKMVIANTINTISNNICAFCSLISIIGMLLVQRISKLYYIDYLFSFRLFYASLKMDRVGIHLLNLMDNDSFYGTDKIIVDNGYLYITLRFGIVLLLVLLFINRMLNDKCDNNLIVRLSIITVFLMGYIDNDFLSYGFLPIMITSVYSNTITKKDMEYGTTFSVNNNEYI